MLLPIHVELRDAQSRAVTDITQAFTDLSARTTRSEPQVVFWQAPVGAGKTFGAVAAIDALGLNRALYVCSGKALQEQFAEDFPNAAMLKGRSNYTPNGLHANPSATCADCNRTGKPPVCSLCVDVEACPYTVAKDAAYRAELAILNTTYLLSEANGPGMFSSKKKPRWPIVICDEADELENELMRHLEFRVPKSTLSQLDLTLPKKGVHRQTMATWLTKLAEAATIQAKSIHVYDIDGEYDAARGRVRAKWTNLAKRSTWMSGQVMEDAWVRDYVKGDPLLYRPVEVSEFGRDLLWDHAPRWLCMSATIVSAQQVARDLGLERHQWAYVESPSTFAPQRRPVVTCGVGQMSFKHREATMPKMIDAVQTIVNLHPGQNILVHTHTYATTDAMLKGVTPDDGRKTWSYASAQDRERVIEAFRDEGGVLFAPSLQRGIDLPDDLCRVVIVTTVPKPYIKDRQISERMHRPYGDIWYDMKVIRSLVQMVGRGMRRETDYCLSYVLDGSFNVGIWRQRRGLFPSWFSESIEPATLRQVLSGDVAERWKARIDQDFPLSATRA